MRHGVRTAGRCLVLGVWALALCASAQPARGFDLVVVLDESGSMKKTDPGNSRCAATEMFVRLCDERQRVALMGFSSSARLLSDLEPMGAGPARESLIAALRGVRSSDSWTNIETGLRQALDELIRSGSPGKPRAILLMTDGAGDLSPGAAAVRASLARVRGPLVAECIQEGVRIYCVAFSKGADRQLLEYLAQATHGLCVAGTREDDLQRLFLRLFEEVAHPQTLPLDQGKVLIDASVTEATFLVTHSPTQTVRLTDPDGRVAAQKDPPTSTAWFSTPRYDLVTVAGPQAGTWSVDPAGQDADSRVIVLTDLKLETRDFPATVHSGQAVGLLALLTASGQVLENAEVTSRVVMQGTLRGEPATNARLADDGAFPDPAAGDGLFGACMTAPRQAGSYDLEIVARAPTLERRLLLSLDVTDAWFDVEIERDVLAPGEVLPLKVRVTNLDIVRKDLRIAFVASVRKPDGTHTEVPVDPVTQYLFTAGFDDTAGEGDYRISVTGTQHDAKGQPVEMTLGPRDFRVMAPIALALPSVVATPEAPVTPEPTPEISPAPTPEVAAGVAPPPARPPSNPLLYAGLGLLAVVVAAGGWFAARFLKRPRPTAELEPAMQQLHERAVEIREEGFDRPEPATPAPAVSVPASAATQTDTVAVAAPTDLHREPLRPRAHQPSSPNPEIIQPVAPSPHTVEDDGVLVAVEGPSEPEDENESGDALSGAEADLLAEIMNEPTGSGGKPASELSAAAVPRAPGAPPEAALPDSLPNEADLLADILGQPESGGAAQSVPPAGEERASVELSESEHVLLAEIMGDAADGRPSAKKADKPADPAPKGPKTDDQAIDDIMKGIARSK